MRKFTLLIASLFLSIGAMAQVNSTVANFDGYEVTFTNVQKNGTTYVLYIDDNSQLAISTETAETLGAAAKFRCNLEASNKLSFYNEAKGVYLVWRGKGAGTNGDKGTLADYNANYCDWDFYNSSNVTGAYYFVSKRGNNNAGSLVILNTGTFDAYGNSEGYADGHSNVFRVDAPGSNIAAKVSLANAIATANEYAAKMGTGVGELYSTDAECVAKFTAVAEFYNSINAETSIESIEAKIEELGALLATLKVNMPVSGKVYTFESQRGWLMSDGNGEYVWNSVKLGTGANASTDNVNCHWVYYATEKGKYLYNVATEKFISYNSANKNLIPLAETPNSSALDFKESSLLLDYPIIVGLEKNAINHNTTNASFTYGALLWGDGWTIAQDDAGSCHKVVEVDDADVATLAVVAARVDAFEGNAYTLTVGDAGWATLYLGSNAVIPGNVEAYTVSTVENGYARLEAATGILAANTGILVKAAAGNYDFVCTTEAATVTESALEGTLYETEISGYVLANDKNGIGFYATADGFVNNANKAYLPATAMSSAAFYGFLFEGTTGVENVEVENGAQVIFDLTGRRIDAINAAGIYIVNGKKVVVK